MTKKPTPVPADVIEKIIESTDPPTDEPKKPSAIEALGMDAFLMAGIVKAVAEQYRIPLNAALRVVDLSISAKLALMQARNMQAMPWSPSETPDAEE